MLTEKSLVNINLVAEDKVIQIKYSFLKWMQTLKNQMEDDFMIEEKPDSSELTLFLDNVTEKDFQYVIEFIEINPSIDPNILKDYEIENLDEKQSQLFQKLHNVEGAKFFNNFFFIITFLDASYILKCLFKFTENFLKQNSSNPDLIREFLGMENDYNHEDYQKLKSDLGWCFK
jgi:hypothetical protein